MMSPGGDSKDHLANYIIRDREFEVGDSVLVPPDPINKTESCELDLFMVSDRISVYNPRIPPTVKDSLLNHNSVVVTGDEEFRDADNVPTGDSNLIKFHDRDALFDLSSTTGGQLIPQRTLPGSMDQTINIYSPKEIINFSKFTYLIQLTIRNACRQKRSASHEAETNFEPNEH